MTVVNMLDAKTRLSKLVEAVESGAEREIIIARNGKPAARLVPIERPTRRILGGLRVSVPDEFFDPLPDDEIAAWEGSLDEEL